MCLKFPIGKNNWTLIIGGGVSVQYREVCAAIHGRFTLILANGLSFWNSFFKLFEVFLCVIVLLL